ncbi:PadR family transcriptional regulator [Ferrimicrobium sp.]|uniref:PadR family transcriptional regulator n=1 Tax=Ferrimicrobium sp. TaxID=2926050 RepID=UPI0026289C6E|nr:PadR family transcriptional regulator [Ferrimicrobium sp.]
MRNEDGMNEHGRHQRGMRGGCGGPGMHGGGCEGQGMRRRRSPRGRVRREILVLLKGGPKHGYELMQLIAERNGGVWQPSPGSVYPTLSMLEDAGLIVGQEDDGRKVYTLTEAGRAEAETLASDAEDDGFGRGLDLGREVRAAFQALRQVDIVGTAEQRQRAQQLLTGLRRDIYQMLAEDPTNQQ